ncbi:hypothetical protein OIU79_009379 [Salix purpurea]|uniref:Uncharacterized protein n=1 Tax=Salix purpurea TaxID=77065 RepID=A0A9Q0TKP0_SALPP|nr:hypothetical protein OIU79_009379 [Salix purpurea]
MNSTQVGILEQPDKVRLCRLLKRCDCAALEPLVASCFLGAFPPVDFLAVCFVRAIGCSGICLFLEKVRGGLGPW